MTITIVPKKEGNEVQNQFGPAQSIPGLDVDGY
jgi:hypothetical protein